MEKWIGLDFGRFSRRERIFARAFLGLGMAALFFSFLHTGLLTKVDPIKEPKRDFATYLAASIAHQEGRPILNPGPWPLRQENVLAVIDLFHHQDAFPLYYYVYPPFLAWLLTPFTVFSYAVAERIWTVGNMVLYFWVVGWFLRRMVLLDNLNRLEMVVCCILAMKWSPVLFVLFGGQISIVILGLLLLHYDCALQKRERISGICLGLAILIKVSPVVFCLFWLIKKRGNLLLYTGATVFLGVLLSGWQETWHFATVIFPHISLGENMPVNLTVMGSFLTMKLGYPWGWLTEDQYQSIGIVHSIIRWAYGCGGLLVVLSVYRSRKRSPTWMDFALLVVSMLFLSPVTRLYDMVYLYPVVVTVYIAYRETGNRWLLFSTLFVSFSFVFNITYWVDMLTFHSLPYQILDKMNIAAMAVFWITLVMFMWRNKTQGETGCP
jgi:hypothetical protein